MTIINSIKLWIICALAGDSSVVMNANIVGEMKVRGENVFLQHINMNGRIFTENGREIVQGEKGTLKLKDIK